MPATPPSFVQPADLLKPHSVIETLNIGAKQDWTQMDPEGATGHWPPTGLCAGGHHSQAWLFGQF